MIFALGSAGTRVAARVSFAIGAITLIMELVDISELAVDLDDQPGEDVKVAVRSFQVRHGCGHVYPTSAAVHKDFVRGSGSRCGLLLSPPMCGLVLLPACCS